MSILIDEVLIDEFSIDEFRLMNCSVDDLSYFGLFFMLHLNCRCEFLVRFL